MRHKWRSRSQNLVFHTECTKCSIEFINNTRDATHVQRNVEACSHNHCGSRKIVSHKYSESLSVPYLSGMKSACLILCCLLWRVCFYHISPHYNINGTIFGNNATEHKMRVWIFSTTFVRNISLSKEKWARCDQKLMLVFI